MKLRQYNFNDIVLPYLSIRSGAEQWYTGLIGKVLKEIPPEYAGLEITATRTFFNSFVIELEDIKNGM